jgi:hypothetical protein
VVPRTRGVRLTFDNRLQINELNARTREREECDSRAARELSSRRHKALVACGEAAGGEGPHKK